MDEEEARLLRLAEDRPRSGEIAQEPVLFLRAEGWRPGRALGPLAASLYYFYRLRGGTATHLAFSRALTVLGFRRHRSCKGSHIMLHHDTAEVLNKWAKANPVPRPIRLAMNRASRPSQRTPLPDVGTCASGRTRMPPPRLLQ